MSDKHLLALKMALDRAAVAFHNAGAQFYTARQEFPYSAKTVNAAKNFQDAAVPYARLLNELQQHLGSLKRDKDLETQYQQVLTRKNALKVILENLSKYYAPE